MEEKTAVLKKWRSAALLFIAVIVFCCALPNEVQAAGKQATIKTCELTNSGKRLYVKVSVKEKTKSMGSKFYLVPLNAYNKNTGTTSTKPVASVKAKKGTIKFRVNYKSDMLYKQFVVAYKSKGKYKIISDSRFITDPQDLAVYRGNGPKTMSKKGLQVEDTADSLELGVQHAVINWTFSSIVNTSGTPYKYRGNTYYFDESLLQHYDNLIKTYNDAGTKVTVILLLPNDADPAVSAMSYGGTASSKFSGIKTTSKEGCREFEAVMSYLAKRYGTQEHLVSGWILGNEVNSPYVWNYGGGKSLNSYMDNYVRSFRICYNAVKSVNKNAKVYISLDNNWNKDADGSGKMYFTSKSVLDTFYKKVNSQGKVVFNIAYHAYPQGMSDPVFWDDSLAVNSVNSKIINFKNLRVLTNYVRKNFGKDYTIMLSEQSFNSSRGQEIQAAAYAYAYYISESNSMIESFIYGREFDNAGEGYNWGLCDGWRGKRLIWNVFQYIDSKDSFKFSNPLKKYTNISAWKKIEGYNDSKYKKMPSKRKDAAIAGIECTASNSLTLTWSKISTADGYEIERWDPASNSFRLIETISDNSTVSYHDVKLDDGGTYVYRMRMYKGAPDSNNAKARVKLYGGYSPQQTATVTTGQVQIDKDKTEVSGGKITIGWNKLSGVNGYEILRATSKDGNYQPIGTTKSTEYTDAATEGGITYYYKVRGFVTANGQNHCGKESEYVSAQAAIELTVQLVNGKMMFNWTKWLDVPEYRLYCSVDGGKTYPDREIISGFNYSDNSIGKVKFVKGQKYYFKARAYYNSVGGKYSNVVVFTIGDDLDTTGSPDSSQIDTETQPTENPLTETPTTETPPTTESPSTEVPPTEKPSTETPTTEAPPTETPSTEIPTTEKPSTEVPSTETLPTEAPSTENKIPSTEMSSTQTAP